MSENWKPGDVAMRVSRVDPDETYVATRVECCTAMQGSLKDEPHWHFVSRHTPTPQCGADGAADYRRLVVIDPEDREQVERFRDLFVTAYCEQTGYTAVDRVEIANAMQAALRVLANPTPPKPDEPTGFLAEIEDATGDRWFRVFERGACPWVKRLHESTNGVHLDICESGAYNTRAYADIIAVHVRSEGVTQ